MVNQMSEGPDFDAIQEKRNGELYDMLKHRQVKRLQQTLEDMK